MAGWLVIGGSAVDASVRSRLEAIDRRLRASGLQVSQTSAPQGRILAWCRTAGEFPSSGRLQGTAHTLAWVGQCYDQEGDRSVQAARALDEGIDSAGLVALNGTFAAARLDPATGGWTAWTDRHGHYPVYAGSRLGLAAASTSATLLAGLLSATELDRHAIASFLACGEFLDEDTPIQGIRQVEGGTTLRFEAAGLSRTRYWRMSHAPDEGVRLTVFARRLGELLRGAVAGIQKANPALGVPLSGGLDSRFLLALCTDPADVPSFTWGLPGCRDVRYAALAARELGSPHHVRTWDPRAFPPLWSSGVAATFGTYGVRDMYVLPFTELLGAHCEVVLNGLAGDLLLGGNIVKRGWLRATSLESLALDTWRWRVEEPTCREVQRLMGTPVEQPRDRWVASILRGSSASPLSRIHEWLYANRIRRWTNAPTAILRQRVESHAPFYDNGFLDELLRVPLRFKLHHRLYLETLRSACPDAARIPWQRTALRPSLGHWPNLASRAWHRAVGAGLRRLGIEAFPSLRVADPAAWLRGPWRQPTEELLREGNSSWFDRDVARELIDRHSKGEDWSRLIGCTVAIQVLRQELIALTSSIEL